MRQEAYVPVGRAERLVAAADELQAAALDLVEEWAEAEFVGDAETGPSDGAVALWLAAERLAGLAAEIADARREA
jgi:hypothetical protein